MAEVVLSKVDSNWVKDNNDSYGVKGALPGFNDNITDNKIIITKIKKCKNLINRFIIILPKI